MPLFAFSLDSKLINGTKYCRLKEFKEFQHEYTMVLKYPERYEPKPRATRRGQASTTKGTTAAAGSGGEKGEAGEVGSSAFMTQ